MPAVVKKLRLSCVSSYVLSHPIESGTFGDGTFRFLRIKLFRTDSGGISCTKLGLRWSISPDDIDGEFIEEICKLFAQKEKERLQRLYDGGRDVSSRTLIWESGDVSVRVRTNGRWMGVCATV